MPFIQKINFYLEIELAIRFILSFYDRNRTKVQNRHKINFDLQIHTDMFFSIYAAKLHFFI